MEPTKPQSSETLRIVAHIYNDYPAKFGIPRQSGLVDALESKIVLEPDYRNADAFRGLEGFSHIWLLWMFSQSVRDTWTPTVHPPHLGGNRRMGVFATRSPFRPSPIGLSSVRLLRLELHTPQGPVLWVSGADLMSGTPIFDIKPYLPYTDSHPDAAGGFAQPLREYHLQVVFPEHLLHQIPKHLQKGLIQLLEQDPRPAYQNDPNRIYGVAFSRYDVRFTVRDTILTVCEVEQL